MLRLTPTERSLAEEYRSMMRRARRRAREEPQAGPKMSLRGREILPDHKRAVSQLFCIATARRHGLLCYGVHVAHLRMSRSDFAALNPGLQRKPDDRWVLPLAPHEHRLQHRLGERAYWDELGLDPHVLAERIFALSPDSAAMGSALRDLVFSSGSTLGASAQQEGARHA